MLSKVERKCCATRRELLFIVKNLPTFPFVPLWTRILPARGPSCAIPASEKDKPPAGFSAYRNTTLLPSTVKPEAQQCRCSFTTAMPRGIYALPQSWSPCRRQTSTSYCSCSRSRMGSISSENGTTIRPRHRAHYTWCGKRATTGVERQPTGTPRIKLMGSVEIGRCKKELSRAELGIHQRTSQIAQIVLSRRRVKMYWPNYTVARQEDTWLSTKPWIKFGKVFTSLRQEAILENDAESATPV
jgi:hypothetical protein